MPKTLLKKFALLSVVTLIAVSSFIYGVVSTQRRNLPFRAVQSIFQQEGQPSEVETKRPGIWGKHKLQTRDSEKKQANGLANLSTLPYLRGYKPAPTRRNVTVYDEYAAYDGLNFVLSANGPNAFLVDMRGNVLHRWHKEFEEIWAEPYDVPAPPHYKSYWRRARLLDNGDLIAMFMDYGLVKLDKDSNVLWAYKGRSHHDLFEADNGNIYVLTRRNTKQKQLQLESKGAGEIVLEDFITVLNPEGEEISSTSVVDCFLNSDYAPLLEHVKVPFDILHGNTIRPIDGKLAEEFPMFKKGHILLSMREIHTIAIVDLEQEKVTWALTGKWKYQHEPRILDNGNILLFDNRGNKGHSQAIEFDPLTQETVWMYRGEPPEAFHSREAGTLDRLANGNTLIIESATGRAFEVTPEKRIVWEFLNPHRAGKKNRLIAVLLDVVRLERDHLSWLDTR